MAHNLLFYVNGGWFRVTYQMQDSHRLMGLNHAWEFDHKKNLMKWPHHYDRLMLVGYTEKWVAWWIQGIYRSWKTLNSVPSKNIFKSPTVLILLYFFASLMQPWIVHAGGCHSMWSYSREDSMSIDMSWHYIFHQLYHIIYFSTHFVQGDACWVIWMVFFSSRGCVCFLDHTDPYTE